MNPFVGRFSDRRGRLVPIRFGLVAARGLLLIVIPIPESAPVVARALRLRRRSTTAAFWTPAMALLSDEVERARVHQGYAFAFTNIAWSRASSPATAAAARSPRRPPTGSATPWSRFSSRSRSRRLRRRPAQKASAAAASVSATPSQDGPESSGPASRPDPPRLVRAARRRVQGLVACAGRRAWVASPARCGRVLASAFRHRRRAQAPRRRSGAVRRARTARLLARAAPGRAGTALASAPSRPAPSPTPASASSRASSRCCRSPFWRARRYADRRVAAVPEPAGVSPGRDQALHGVGGGLRVRAAALVLPEAAVAVLRAAQVADGLVDRPAPPGRRQRLDRRAGVVHVALRARREPEAAVVRPAARTASATARRPRSIPAARRARIPNAVYETKPENEPSRGGIRSSRATKSRPAKCVRGQAGGLDHEDRALDLPHLADLAGRLAADVVDRAVAAALDVARVAPARREAERRPAA